MILGKNRDRKAPARAHIQEKHSIVRHRKESAHRLSYLSIKNKKRQHIKTLHFLPIIFCTKQPATRKKTGFRIETTFLLR